MATWKKLAYADEVATLSDTNPSDIGTAASAGTGDAASRYDHVHVIGTGAINAAAMFGAEVVENAAIGDGAVDTEELAADAVTGDKLADDAVGSEHIEPLSATLEVNGQQLKDACLENNAADPTTPVLGKVYFKTGDTHPYVCTAV